MTSRSDSIKPRAEPAFVGAGIGTDYRFRCSRCRQPMRNHGRRLEMVRGVKQYVGRCCQTAKATP